MHRRHRVIRRSPIGETPDRARRRHANVSTQWEALYSELKGGAGVKLADARKRIDPGLPAAKATAALGKPSFAVRTEGASSHEIWKYYFADGTLTVNVTDGYVARISTDFGPPKIRQSRRP